MAVGCGAKFAKIMLIIFDIIFLCSGIVLIALGIWLLVILSQSYGPAQVFTLASGADLYRNAAILLIAMGCLILFVTILGLVAAIRESSILLTIFAVFLFLIFAGEIAGGVVAIVYKDWILNTLNDTLRESLGLFDRNNTYYSNTALGHCTSSAIGRLWDYTQIMFTCCGVDEPYDQNDGLYNGYKDMSANQCEDTKKQWPNIQLIVPLTCCAHNKSSLSDFNYDNQANSTGMFDCTTYVQQGCTNSIINWIIAYAPVLIGIGLGFGMLQMFGFIFVICLCMNTDKGFKRF